jgi:hypothetical protein
VSWLWEEFTALPSETFTVDIHCVTNWSKLDTSWTGVSLDTLLGSVETRAKYAKYVSAFCDGGYTTNVPLEDLTGGKAGIAYEYDGRPRSPDTRVAGTRGQRAAGSGCITRSHATLPRPGPSPQSPSSGTSLYPVLACTAFSVERH